jgi:hypothetical protein
MAGHVFVDQVTVQVRPELTRFGISHPSQSATLRRTCEEVDPLIQLGTVGCEDQHGIGLVCRGGWCVDGDRSRRMENGDGLPCFDLEVGSRFSRGVRQPEDTHPSRSPFNCKNTNYSFSP